MRTRWMVLAAMAVALTGSPALARGDDSLNSLSSNGYSPRQVEALQRTTARGDAEAMYDLAMAYRDGEGAAVDLKKAFHWFLKAALKGNIEAMNEVGCAYFRGTGVAVDYVVALDWFRKAAGKGDVIAMLNVGVAYDLGQGVAIDDAEAVRWYPRSAEGGDPTATLYLANMYERAEGVRMDFEDAARWTAAPPGPRTPKNGPRPRTVWNGWAKASCRSCRRRTRQA